MSVISTSTALKRPATDILSTNSLSSHPEKKPFLRLEPFETELEKISSAASILLLCCTKLASFLIEYK
jgi:hypothetical protein